MVTIDKAQRPANFINSTRRFLKLNFSHLNTPSLNTKRFFHLINFNEFLSKSAKFFIWSNVSVPDRLSQSGTEGLHFVSLPDRSTLIK